MNILTSPLFYVATYIIVGILVFLVPAFWGNKASDDAATAAMIWPLLFLMAITIGPIFLLGIGLSELRNKIAEKIQNKKQNSSAPKEPLVTESVSDAYLADYRNMHCKECGKILKASDEPFKVCEHTT